jgi:hypothetical protein
LYGRPTRSARFALKAFKFAPEGASAERDCGLRTL